MKFSPILWKVEHSVNGILVGKVMPSPRAVFTGTNHSQALGPITLCTNPIRLQEKFLKMPKELLKSF